MKFNFLLVLTTAFLLTTCQSNSQDNNGLETRDLATGLDTPWEILWGPDNYIWMTERYGRISRVNPENGDVTELITIDKVSEGGEKGLMGMALHPDFENNPHVFVVYNYMDGGNTFVAVSRWTYDGEKIEENSEMILIDGIAGSQIHDGSRLWIREPEMKLYITTGDAANASSAQNLNSLNGKTLRLNLDGSVPEDNPFPGSPIWSWGHRNAQGMVVHNDIMYQSEHGPADNDEVNIIYKGRNYGWPDVHGYCDQPEEQDFCADSNVVEPIEAWTPTLAVAGLDFYDKSMIQEWENSLLLANLKASRIVQLKLSQDGMTVESTTDFFTNQFGRLRDICISPDGKVYISTSNKDGRGSPAPQDDRIIEITPKPGSVDTINGDSGSLMITPNPAYDSATISFSGALKPDAVLSIYDNLGNLVKKFPYISAGGGIDIDQIDFKSIGSGVYHALLENGGNTYAEKLIIY